MAGDDLSLGRKQRLFCKLLPRLMDYAHDHGYELSLGEAWRTPEQAARNEFAGIGTRNSLHVDRLAIDLNLFRGGKWLSDSESHRPLADYWKTLHPLCRWGGDFRNPDGNHYSMTRGGRA
jgi:hypothetical protein